jgi:hypothetical protein
VKLEWLLFIFYPIYPIYRPQITGFRRGWIMAGTGISSLPFSVKPEVRVERNPDVE